MNFLEKDLLKCIHVLELCVCGEGDRGIVLKKGSMKIREACVNIHVFSCPAPTNCKAFDYYSMWAATHWTQHEGVCSYDCCSGHQGNSLSFLMSSRFWALKTPDMQSTLDRVRPLHLIWSPDLWWDCSLVV